MADEVCVELANEAATVALAERVAGALPDGHVLYLVGDLGAGKTTFARALLQALGVEERIKSPTYSLLESYVTRAGQRAWHLDLYRIADPGELEWLGLDELHDAAALVLVEWPERGGGWLPAADTRLHIQHTGTSRTARLQATSARGRDLLARLHPLGSPHPPGSPHPLGSPHPP